jgi:hypothetical protein
MQIQEYNLNHYYYTVMIQIPIEKQLTHLQFIIGMK